MSNTNDTLHDARKEAESVAHDAQTRAKSVVDDVSSQVRHVAHDASETVKSEVSARAEKAKGAAAGEVGNVATALRKAAEESRSGSAQERTFGQIADTLADASDAISNKDLGTAIGDVTDFARRNPVTFLIGAALAGFAVSRFVKASDSHDVRTADADEFMTPRHGNADFGGRV